MGYIPCRLSVAERTSPWQTAEKRRMGQARYLIVVADDFGIGPETTRGILELGAKGLVTGSVLLTNSPYAESALKAWRQAGEPVEIGWHPCLTLDGPILPPEKVPSLV